MAINPSLALVNHDCDANALRCSVNKSSVLVASYHIQEGEEITESYTVHYRNADHDTRQYHTLKNYMFACDCEACRQKYPQDDTPWPLDIPDELHAIPSFEQEKVYKVSFGDKKAIVKKIRAERALCEKWMGEKRFSQALESYRDLCADLDEHVKKPHTYYLQCRSGITHCIWNLHCTQFPEQPLDDYDDSQRDLAKEIYSNNLTEEVPTEYEVVCQPEEETQGELPSEEDQEKAVLMEVTRKMLDSSTARVAEVRAGTEAIKTESEEAKQAYLEEEAQPTHTINGHIPEGDPVENSPKKIAVQEIVEKETAEMVATRKKEEETKAKEQQERMSRRKQWEEEDKQRQAREQARKKRREEETQDQLKRTQEKEKKMKENKKAEEEEKRRQREMEFEDMKREEKEKRERLKREKQQQMRDEEYELTMLLSEIGDSFEPDAGVLAQLEADQDRLPYKTEREIQTLNSDAAGKLQTLEASSIVVIDKVEVECHTNGVVLSSSARPLDRDIPSTPCLSEIVTSSNKKPSELNNHDFLEPSRKRESKPENESEPNNVWAALRKIKESATPDMFDTSSNGETISLDDFDNMMKNLPTLVMNDAKAAKELKAVAELGEEHQENECNDNKEISVKETSDEKLEETIVETKEFNYEDWKTEIETIFSGPGDRYSFHLEKDAADELYFQNLKNKIAQSVAKQSKEMKKTEKENALNQKTLNTPPVTPTTTRKEGNDFVVLKLKEKERKSRKRDQMFNQHMAESKDKFKDMAVKAAKFNQISIDTESEILKLRERSKCLVAKSNAQEHDFEEIFKNINNIDALSAMTLDSDKKKGRKKSKDAKEIVEPVADKDELHWTEEDRGKWNSSKTSNTQVSDLLTAMRSMAGQGNTGVLDSLKNTISQCQKIDADNKVITKKMKTETKEKTELLSKPREIETKEKDQLKNSYETKILVERPWISSTSQNGNHSTALDKKQEDAESRRREEEEEEEDRQIRELEEKLERRQKEEEKLRIDLIKKEIDMERDNKSKVEEEKRLAKIRETEEQHAKEIEMMKIKYEKEEETKKAKKLKEEELRKQEAAIKHKKAEEDKKKMAEEKIKLREEANKKLKIEREQKLKKQEEEKLYAEKEARKKQEEVDRKRQLKETEQLKRIAEQKKNVEEEKQKLQFMIDKKKREDEDKLKKEKEQNNERKQKMENLKKQKQVEEEQQLININGTNKETYGQKIKVEAEKRKAEEKDQRLVEIERIKEQEERQSQCLPSVETEEAQRIPTETDEERERRLEEEEDKQIAELEEKLALRKAEEAQVILDEEKRLIKLEADTKRNAEEAEEKRSSKLQAENKRIAEEADESLQQIEMVKRKLNEDKNRQSSISAKTNPVQEKPGKVVVVDHNSFVPQKNTKHEIGVIKMGSPSQIRRAVKMEVKIEESEPLSLPKRSIHEDVENYQITRIPTTSFQVRKPRAKTEEKEPKFSITEVPMSTVVLEQLARTYTENVVKYSETMPTDARNKTTNAPRPPPPTFKPPPPPPTFKPPPPPPVL